MNVEISVVIPTLDRDALLRRTLECLRTQSLDKVLYEIVIVDDGNRRQTRKLCADFAFTNPQLTVRYLNTSGRRGPSCARNIGWKAALGAIIAFTDDDCLPSHNWLSAAYIYFADDKLAGLSGRILVPISGNPSDHEWSVSWMEKTQFMTANCFYRRDALEAVGGFDERFTIAWREDTDLYFSLKERGMHTLSADDVIVVHPVREAPWWRCVHEERKNAWNALLYKKHPRLYRTAIESAPPLNYYIMTIAGVFTVVGGLLGLKIIALYSVLVWFIFTVNFTLFRLRHTSSGPRQAAEMFATSSMIPFLSVFWRLVGAVRYQAVFW